MTREYIMNLILTIQDQQVSSSDNIPGIESNEVYNAMTFIGNRRNGSAIMVNIVSSTKNIEPDRIVPNYTAIRQRPIQDDNITSTTI